MSTQMTIAIATALLLAGHAAAAQSPTDESTLSSLTANAELVFDGTVTNIAYATSTDGVPHTFVTYRINDVLKGAYAARRLTLRFIGGEQLDGDVLRKLSVSHMPSFATGQQDLLMVKGNTQLQCPLVRCTAGRFRFQEGYVTSEDGSVIARDPQGRLLVTPPAGAGAGGGDTGAGARNETNTARIETTPFDRTGFIAHVRDVIGRLDLHGRTTSAVVRTADPGEPFKGPNLAIAPTPREQRPQWLRQPAAAQSEHDRLEREALTRNGGNPVLPQKDVEALNRLPTAPPR